MDPKQDQQEQSTVVTLEEEPKTDQEEDQNLEKTDDQNAEQDDSQTQEVDEKGESKAEEDLGVEVVLESSGEAGEKEPRKNFGKRIQKMNEKIEVAEQNEQKANSELKSAKERITQLEDQNKIRNLADQKKADVTDPHGPPDPDKFDGGEYDPEYRKQFNA